MDKMLGFSLINEMSKDQLIDEFLLHQRKELEKMEMPILKGQIITIRVNAYRERLEKEAGVSLHQGIFGTHVEETD